LAEKGFKETEGDRVLVAKSEGKRPLGRFTYTWERQ